MAESGDVSAPPEAAAASSTPAREPEAPKPAPSVEYDESVFWKTIPIGVCTPMVPSAVLAATKDLCISLLLEEEAPSVMEKAAKLAAQLRDRCQKMVVNHDEELQQFFDLKPDVSLDLSVPEKAKHFAKSAKRWQNDFAAMAESLTESEALAFGPTLACLILRLGKHDIRSVAKKVCKLTTKLSCWGMSHPQVHLTEKNAVSLLWKYAGAKPKKVLANTVFGAFMYAYHKQPLLIEVKGLLDFLVLQSMRRFGMALVTLVEGVQQGKQIKLFFELSAKRGGLESWQAYIKFYQQYKSKLKSTSEFWRYSRAFDDKVFSELSYSRNQWLCNLSAHLTDLYYNEKEVKEWPVLGPRYQRLIRSRSKSLGLSRDDVIWAKEIYDLLDFELHRPLSSVLREITNKILRERYGPDTKWQY